MRYKEAIIIPAGKGFMTIRHLTIHGTNHEIGKKLAEISIDHHSFSKEVASANNQLILQALKSYIAQNYPILLNRSKGVADALDIDFNDNNYDTTSIPLGINIPSTPNIGCSTVYYPASITDTKHAYLSRNYDFLKGTVADISDIPFSPEIRQILTPIMAEPYLIEMHPEDGGYASVCMTCFDLLSGVLDGINSQGLTVAVNGYEGDLAQMQQIYEPNLSGVGLNEIQVMRLLLDTCSNCEDAKQALLVNKQYYTMAPCHYLIADADGNSFIYEHSPGGNKEFIIDSKAKPQILTNHNVHMYPNVTDIPNLPDAIKNGYTSYERYQILEKAIEQNKGSCSVDLIKQINHDVSVSQIIKLIPDEIREQFKTGYSRTLWHAIYDIDNRSLDIKFYLNEESKSKGNFIEHYSDYFHFTLGG